MTYPNAIDMTFSIKWDMELMLNKHTPVIMLTDSLSLFHVIPKSTKTTEKRLMIEIIVAKDSSQPNELNTIRFVRSENNLADALIKIRKCTKLDLIFARKNLNHPREQWGDKKTCK